MDGRASKPKTFAFTREIKGSNARRVYPNNEENDDVSIQSIEQNSPLNTQAQSNETLLESNQNTVKQKKFLTSAKKSGLLGTSTAGLLIAGGIILIICLIIILPTVLGVVLTRNPSVTNSTSTSTAASTVYSAYWSFDYNANDLYGVYNGVLMNGATYSNTTYFGFGSNLQLNASINQSLVVSSPFLNLSYTSFTVEAWIYGVSLSGDNSIFSQCYCNSCQDQCLYLLIRNYKMYMGFTLDDLLGTTTLSVNTWYHVAYVYDYSAKTQYLYLQGVLDNSRTSAGPYQGSNASIVIGSSQLSSASFNGFIDNLLVTTRAKSVTELLSDATVVVYFSFDGTSLTYDSGPNKMNGTISNAAAVTGKVGQALAFTGAVSSYLQIYGFYQLGQSNKAFSFAMWLYPYSVNGGVLILTSSNQNQSGWCYSLMGLNYFGQIAMLVYNSNVPIIVGNVLPVRTWTHLAQTYSQTNGVQMYINGYLFGTTGSVSWSSSSTIDWLSIGSYVTNYCGPGSGTIYPTPYQGAIDEFYVYRRELNASEVLALANA